MMFVNENDTERDNPDSKVHGTNMGPIWGRQDPAGPLFGPINFVLWENKHDLLTHLLCFILNCNYQLSFSVELNLKCHLYISSYTFFFNICKYFVDHFSTTKQYYVQ